MQTDTTSSPLDVTGDFTSDGVDDFGSAGAFTGTLPGEQPPSIPLGHRMETRKRRRLVRSLLGSKLAHDRAPLVVRAHAAMLRATSRAGREETAGAVCGRPLARW